MLTAFIRFGDGTLSTDTSPDVLTRALRDPITREVLRVVEGKATVPVHARGVRMLLVE